MTPDAAVLSAIASPRRREILRLTWRGERGAAKIRAAMPDVSWGAVSLQVRALVDAGLLHARIDGRRRYYRADRTRLAGVAAMLEDMWSDVLWKLKLAAELEATRRGPPPAFAEASAGRARTAKATAGKSVKLRRGKPVTARKRRR